MRAKRVKHAMGIAAIALGLVLLPLIIAAAMTQTSSRSSAQTPYPTPSVWATPTPTWGTPTLSVWATPTRTQATPTRPQATPTRPPATPTRTAATPTRPPATPSVSQLNLLQNPSFEKDSNADNRPDSWKSDSRFTRSAASATNGSYSGKFTASDGSTVSITQNVYAITSGRQYKVSGWMNIPQSSQTLQLKVLVEWRNSQNTVLKSDVVIQYSGTTTSGWKAIPVKTMLAPQGAVTARVYLQTPSLRGTMYVDNFQFIRI